LGVLHKKGGRMRSKILYFIIGVSLCGCIKTTVYLARRDVPENPSISVFPANYFTSFIYSTRPDAEIKYANEIEFAVIEAGVKIVQRPGIKIVKTTKGAAKGRGEEDVEVAAMTMEEYYAETTGPKPDYIILTYLLENRIRILKRETGEILFSGYITRDPLRAGVAVDTKEIKEILLKLGIAKSKARDSKTI